MLVRKLIEEHVLQAGTKQYKAGDILFAAGQLPENVYYMVDGAATLLDESGAQVQQLLPGSLAGFADVLNDDYCYSAIVTSPAEVLVINRDCLLHLLERNPDLRLYFLRLLSRGIVRAQPLYE